MEPVSTQDIGRIYQDIAGCFGPVAARLRQRLRRLRATVNSGAFCPKELARLQRDIAASRDFVNWRRDNRPQPEYPEELPVCARREDIARLIAENQIVIIAGETGSGKTTQLPKICIDLGRGIKGMIGCTQPRRVAAISVAERVAAELKTSLGEAVGYQVRFDGHLRRETYVKFMTDGILLSETRGDPDLLEYDTLIIDEAHERSLNIDFILGYLKRLLPRRPDLKVIISSATLEVERFRDFFGGAPFLAVEGRTFPVEIIHREIADEDADLPVVVGHALEELYARHGAGDTLIFMTGEQDIRETVLHLQKRKLSGAEVLPLYSRLSPAEQRLAFHPGERRRIIVTTNVAETSVTVPRVRYVVDTGLARIKRFNARTQVESLQIEPISQASARQRAGRCGRVGPGICLRLYSEENLLSRPEYTDPEIKRSSLAGVILQMSLLRLGRVEEFPFIEPPPPQLVRSGYDELEELGALDENRVLTRTGKRIAAMPMEPRFGRMLLAAQENGSLSDALVIVAALCIQDPRLRPADKREAADYAHRKYRDKLSDFAAWLHLWRELERQREGAGSNNRFHRWCKENFLSYLRLREWRNTVEQLGRILEQTRAGAGKGALPAIPPFPGQTRQKHGKGEKPEEIALHKALLCGLFSRCGLYHEEEREYRGARETKFVIWPGSGLSGSNPKWLMAAEIVETSRPFARCCAVIDPVWLEELAPHLLKRSYASPYFDEKSGVVRALMNATFYGLPVISGRRVHYGPVDPLKAREIFIRDGLVGRKLNTKLKFYQHNNRLITNLEEEQHKLRRKDLLVDTENLFIFYDSRLPQDLHSLKQLERFCHSPEGAGRLFMSADDVTLADAGGLSRDLFPPQLLHEGLKFPLHYRFEPGHTEDGVSCTLPLGALVGLTAERFDWLVPGLLGEKIAHLIRSLPRSLRKEFNPIPQTVEHCMPRLKGQTGDFYAALAQELHRCGGVRIAPGDFRPEELPAFLRMNFRIIDTSGTIIAQGRDLAALQKECARQASKTFQAAPKNDFERGGIRDWDFALPQRLQLAGGALGWPGLIDEGQSVTLKILEDAGKAAAASRRGVCRLARIVLDSQCSRIVRSFNLSNNALLYYAAIKGGRQMLEEEALLAGLLHIYDRHATLPRNRAEFDAFLEAVRAGLYAAATQTAKAASDALMQAAELCATLEAPRPPNRQPNVEDIRLRLSCLIYPGFVRDAGVENAPHLPRYVQALRARLEKMDAAPAKDRARMEQINPLWQRCLEGFARLRQRGKASAALAEYRWLLEEYAVSLYAQELGTARPVSDKRLEEQWKAAEKEL